MYEAEYKIIEYLILTYLAFVTSKEN